MAGNCFTLDEPLKGLRFRTAFGDWTVIYEDKAMCRILRTDVSGLRKMDIVRPGFVDRLNAGEFKVVKETTDVVPPMSVEARNRLANDWDMVQEVRATYGPDYSALFTHERKEDLWRIFERHGMKKTSGMDKVGRFLKGGMCRTALVDPRYLSKGRSFNRTRKNGAPVRKPTACDYDRPLSEDDYAAFEHGLRYWLHSEKPCWTAAYGFVRLNYYSDVEDGKLVLRPAPSQRRFEYYCKTHTTAEQRLKAGMKEREFFNNLRLVYDTNISNAYRAGADVEIDAFEPDIQLVSSQDPTKLVGKATVYTVMDVKTRMLLDISVGFEENSVIGITNLVRNLLTRDLLNWMHRCGLEDVGRDVVPGNVHPTTVYLDRGPEMKADETIEVLGRVGIRDIRLEPPATGSMKGMVERSYRTFMDSVRSELVNYGLTTGKHGDNGKKTAALTIEGFEKLMLRFIVTHNSSPVSKYILTKDMLAQKNVEKSPRWLWKYETSRPGTTVDYVPVSLMADIIYQLMDEVTATITREGLVYNRLVYAVSGDPELRDRCIAHGENAGKRHKSGEIFNSVNVRIDRRDIGALYINRDGKIVSLPINTARCGFGPGMPWAVFETRFLPTIRDAEREGKETAKIQRMMLQAYTAYIAETSRRLTYASTEHETENLAAEKAFMNYKDNLGNTLRELEGKDPAPADVIELNPEDPDAKALPVARIPDPMPDTVSEDKNGEQSYMEAFYS